MWSHQSVDEYTYKSQNWGNFRNFDQSVYSDCYCMKTSVIDNKLKLNYVGRFVLVIPDKVQGSCQFSVQASILYLGWDTAQFPRIRI